MAGVGTIGTQVLIYGLVSNYYPTNARAAGVAWCAGSADSAASSGRSSAAVLVGAGVGGSTAFQLFAALSVAGAAVAALVPRQHPVIEVELPVAAPASAIA